MVLPDVISNLAKYISSIIIIVDALWRPAEQTLHDRNKQIPGFNGIIGCFEKCSLWQYALSLMDEMWFRKAFRESITFQLWKCVKIALTLKPI